MKSKNVAKVVVLNHRDEVLLLRRSQTDSRRPGEWDFPGGGVDEGEDFAQAAARELLEEAGLQASKNELKLLYTGTEFYAPSDETVNRMLFLRRLGDTATASVTLSQEHNDYKWASIGQALQDFPHPFYGVGLQYALEHGLLN
jgi:mutator protein MutT